MEEAGEFAGGHTVALREGVNSDEAFAARRENGSFDLDTVDGIGAVEDDKGLAGFVEFLHDVTHGADVGVEAGADILDVKDDDIYRGEHLGRGPAFGVFVKAPDFDFGGGVEGVGYFFVIFGTEDAVFGGEDGGEFYAGGDHRVDIAAAVAGEAGVVGDKADAFAFEAGELFLFQNIETGFDCGVTGDGTADAAHGFVVAVEDGAGGIDAESGGGDGSYFGAEGGDGRAALRMNAVGEEDDVGVGGGVDPERCTGEAGMAEGAEGEEFAAVGGELGVHVEAEAAEDGLVGWGLGLGELGDGEGAEETAAVEFAFV